ncbi:hypothetical protein HYPSUDRAFT_196034 [Hypholoma sublateritium FD-334 SS-4]|uniref:Uncharacterized protein n=1 Tax=Hypholoma sublateritium (strain FD-334 SS-4) TaxID=945553 RepID=A0A0D2PNC6_HYPSF|nr:hypothetical protein HYPSUDRAFT_196034 [Hypholoma sublateritium FD-334 SS-4]
MSGRLCRKHTDPYLGSNAIAVSHCFNLGDVLAPAAVVHPPPSTTRAQCRTYAHAVYAPSIQGAILLENALWGVPWGPDGGAAWGGCFCGMRRTCAPMSAPTSAPRRSLRRPGEGATPLFPPPYKLFYSIPEPTVAVSRCYQLGGVLFRPPSSTTRAVRVFHPAHDLPSSALWGAPWCSDEGRALLHMLTDVRTAARLPAPVQAPGFWTRPQLRNAASHHRTPCTRACPTNALPACSPRRSAYTGVVHSVHAVQIARRHL